MGTRSPSSLRKEKRTCPHQTKTAELTQAVCGVGKHCLVTMLCHPRSLPFPTVSHLPRSLIILGDVCCFSLYPLSLHLLSHEHIWGPIPSKLEDAYLLSSKLHNICFTHKEAKWPSSLRVPRVCSWTWKLHFSLCLFLPSLDPEQRTLLLHRPLGG